MTLDLGCSGRTDVRTPNIDRLAAEGVVYTNARCVAPLSSPTRSAMMTGLHHEITASHNHRTNRDRPLPGNSTSSPASRPARTPANSSPAGSEPSASSTSRPSGWNANSASTFTNSNRKASTLSATTYTSPTTAMPFTRSSCRRCGVTGD